MPPRTKRARTSYKMKNRKKSRRARKSVVRNRTNVKAGKGFPKKMTMTHIYAENIVLSTSSGVIGKYYFSCNGMYKPNQSAAGHQPSYFDTMISLYNHFTVIGAKITARFVPASQQPVPSYIALMKNDDAVSSLGNIETMQESNSGKYRQVPPNSTDGFTLTSKWSAKKTFGGSVLANDNLQGNAGANPLEETTWVLAAWPADNAQAIAYYVNVKIEYIAVWEENTELVRS